MLQQSERAELYREALGVLQAKGLAFFCTCSRADLARAASAPHEGEDGPLYPGTCRAGPTKARHPASVRFRAQGGPTSFVDLVRGPYTQDVAEAVGDFVIRRADGIASYQLAVVVDDAATKVTHVLRGDDLLSSTPRQLQLYAALDLKPPRFAHVPLLVDPSGQRLAKRDGSSTVAFFRERGDRARAPARPDGPVERPRRRRPHHRPRAGQGLLARAGDPRAGRGTRSAVNRLVLIAAAVLVPFAALVWWGLAALQHEPVALPAPGGGARAGAAGLRARAAAARACCRRGGAGACSSACEGARARARPRAAACWPAHAARRGGARRGARAADPGGADVLLRRRTRLKRRIRVAASFETKPDGSLTNVKVKMKAADPYLLACMQNALEGAHLSRTAGYRRASCGTPSASIRPGRSRLGGSWPSRSSRSTAVTSTCCATCWRASRRTTSTCSASSRTTASSRSRSTRRSAFTGASSTPSSPRRSSSAEAAPSLSPARARPTPSPTSRMRSRARSSRPRFSATRRRSTCSVQHLCPTDKPHLSRTQRLFTVSADDLGPFTNPTLRLAVEADLNQLVPLAAATVREVTDQDPLSVDARAFAERVKLRVRASAPTCSKTKTGGWSSSTSAAARPLGAELEGLYTVPDARRLHHATLSLGQISRHLLSSLPRLTLRVDDTNAQLAGLARKVGYLAGRAQRTVVY